MLRFQLLFVVVFLAYIVVSEVKEELRRRRDENKSNTTKQSLPTF